ncbi:hypothetical protein CRI77_21245 [Mycolicibacterium duvalii]|uniref:Uncharacterized protein n=1 Tax=Mycolicibacterium duvalii TaxID=39688 RepID=A0A7I7JXB6_9MYCO|nr:hypothetical protein [Mycolicibacterium duvalii]MCV7370322.1 hypothetical protein [Mycolicibacterium duvalii]PEG37291.1 hypothetical protein CRI77_21245 [Mycolicibacterium duvalii]BBX16500.1 hypothetical protein MDUV_13600 [Mycolicibacterium duvalii]
MGVVMGLSLTSDEVVWVIITDEEHPAVVDHDARQVTDGGADVVVASARSAHVVATSDGLAIDTVRITGRDGVPADLVVRLRALGFRHVEVVDFDEALAAGQRCAPQLQAAAGAAVSRPDAATPPVPAPRRRGVMAALVGTAAAAVLSVLFLTTGSVPAQSAHAAPAVPAGPAAVESGWRIVPVVSPSTATQTRKFVTAAPPRTSAPVYYSASAPKTAAPAAGATATPALQNSAVTGEQHLTGTALPAGPQPVPASDSGTVMTDLSNLFTALP